MSATSKAQETLCVCHPAKEIYVGRCNDTPHEVCITLPEPFQNADRAHYIPGIAITLPPREARQLAKLLVQEAEKAEQTNIGDDPRTIISYDEWGARRFK